MSMVNRPKRPTFEEVDENAQRLDRVFGKGTAYPVGSPSHDEPPKASNLPGIPVGPINLPKLEVTTEFTLFLSPEQIYGMLSRQLAIMRRSDLLLGFESSKPELTAYSDEDGVLIRVTFESKSVE